MAPAKKRGKKTFEDGIYIGDLVKTKRHGNGIFTYNDGCIYSGEWVQNSRDGHGSYTWPDEQRKNVQAPLVDDIDKLKKQNSKKKLVVDANADDLLDNYIGKWKADKMDGEGTLTWAKGKGKYSGEWKDNAFNGKGTCRWPDGKQYQGEWISDKKHGRGFFLFGDGRTFEGDFEKDFPRKGLLVERDGNAFLTTYDGWTQQSMWLPALKKRVGKFEGDISNPGVVEKPAPEPKTQKKSEKNTTQTNESETLPKCVFIWDNFNSVQYRRFEGTRMGLCPLEGVLIKNDGMFKVKYEGKAHFAENPIPISSVIYEG